jgi:hypothetical protein
VHKPPGHTPHSSRWPYVHGIEPVEKVELARRRTSARPRRQEMGLRSILGRRLQPQHALRGPDSCGREGSHPLRCARNPRSRGAHGRRTQRQGTGLYAHRHPPHREGRIDEEWGGGSGLSELRRQSLEQQRIEGERVEQELKVARRIQHTSLPKEIPQLEGWKISPFYQPATDLS